MKEASKRCESDAYERQRLNHAFPEPNQGADVGLIGEPRVDRRFVGMVKDVHDVRAAYAGRIVQPGVLKAARLEILNTFTRPGLHIGLCSEHNGTGRTRLDTRRLQANADAVRTQGALV